MAHGGEYTGRAIAHCGNSGVRATAAAAEQKKGEESERRDKCPTAELESA